MLNAAVQLTRHALSIRSCRSVQQFNKNIKKRFGKALTDDPNCKDFISKLNDLVNSHPFFKKEKNE